jgi:hypothetical protein
MDSIVQLTAKQRAELFAAASQQLGLNMVVIEKDFWVCWTLRQLFTLPGLGEHLIFKGGTSLSKVWRVIERFSEDIDVSLSREWLGFAGEQDPETAGSGKQRKKRLEELSAACAVKIREMVLPGLTSQVRAALGAAGWDIAVSPDDAQTLLFRYPSALDATTPGAYIRREVKIEGGARSDDWPADDQTIRPYVAEAFPERLAEAKASVRVLSAERTFWEKATILHAEAHREAGKPTPARFSRHYADLAALGEHAAGKRAVTKDDLRARVVAHKTVFFPSAWAHYETAAPGSFRLIPDERRLADLERDYREMQEMYFGTPHSWAEIVARLHKLETAINTRNKS